MHLVSRTYYRLNIDRKEQSHTVGSELGVCFFDDFWRLQDALTLRKLPWYVCVLAPPPNHI